MVSCESILRRAEGNEIVETVGVVAFVVKVQQVGELEVEWVSLCASITIGGKHPLLHLYLPPAPISRPST